RIAEGAGEDPCLGTAMALARVRGFQTDDLPVGHRISACPKHYVGYGAAEGGRDYNTVELSERTLRDIYLPPFKAALDAGAGSIMSAFNEIAGIPGTCNTFLLRTVLRDEWGWDGVVVSDYNSIGELVQHGVAADLREAARLSILAGVDLDMESGAYDQHLASLVRSGEVPVELVDEAVRRVLQLKFSLGLFEHAEVDASLAERTLMSPEFRALALEVAQQSMVLLKNEDHVLPLEAGKQRIALIGPLANNRADLLGTWSMASQASKVETVLHGLTQYDDRIIYEQGCSIVGDADLNLAAAVNAAEQADVVVLVVGESAAMSGEAHSRVYLGLPGRQQELFDALAATGKPIITVLMSGRPLVIPQIAQKSAALLVGWHGGIRAGQAAADLLFGAVNPSGKLTASFPRTEGQIPVFYAHKATGRPAESEGTTQFHEPFRSTYLDESNSPLFAFGEGLSYSRFEYSDLDVLTPSVARDGTLRVTASVQNVSNRSGDEIVQLYVRDLVGSVTRPVKELKGFQRVTLAAGEKRQVRFDIPVSELGFHGVDMSYRVEPGAFKVWIGADSAHGLEGAFTVVE
ncbi:MAG: glycoside hydrolase family 3 C-terminal domain-containing protein, partial [Anaerolinea sp.]|nr:glycoside hydrolase family 3 C-terminal domain-containing protein [Anaerolinea sp.]